MAASRPTFPNLQILGLECPGTIDPMKAEEVPCIDADRMKWLIHQSFNALAYTVNQLAFQTNEYISNPNVEPIIHDPAMFAKSEFKPPTPEVAIPELNNSISENAIKESSEPHGDRRNLWRSY